MRRPSDTVVAAAVFTVFFAVYAFTAGRGLGWGDSGEFQHWILDGVDLSSRKGFSNIHPLYVWLGRSVASTTFGVNVISSFFGALALAGFFLLTRNLAVTVLFGFSHALWWLSTTAEVLTMSLAFVVFETFFFLKWLRGGRLGHLVAFAFLNGLHLEAHNLALLALPVYAVAFANHAWRVRPARRFACGAAAVAAWAAGASYWLFNFFARGPADVLFGSYGAQVSGVLPGSWPTAVFNWALAAMSFAPVPFLWKRRGNREPYIVALFAVHFVFWIRYFIISQFTFVLPSLFFAYLVAAMSRRNVSFAAFSGLLAIDFALPVAAFLTLSAIGFPSWYWSHPHRDDAAYFALPWKFNDDSADRCASEMNGPWDGYWHPEMANGIEVR